MSNVEGSKKQELKKAKKIKLQKINAKDRADDIPNCPSLKSIEYYDTFGPENASDDKSDLTIADDLIDHERVQKVKEEIQDKVIKRQREKDLEELYGIVDDTSSSEEDEQRSNAIKELNEPYTYLKPKSYPKYNYSSESDDDSVNAAAKRERVKKREKQMQEMVDNVIWASLSLGKQSAILFGKMINYSAKYPTPAGIAIIVIGLYFSIMHLELSAAAFAEWCIQWYWPTTRIFLRGSVGFLKRMAAFLNELDEFGQSTYCDMADLWCTEFDLMCNRKCSFLSNYMNTKHEARY